MNTSFTRWALSLLGAAQLCVALPTHAAAIADRSAALERIAARPLLFEPNAGQADQRAAFVARAPGYTVFFTRDSAVFSWMERTPAAGRDRRHRHPNLRGEGALRVHFSGANPRVQISGEERASSTANYFLGQDETRWRADVPNFNAVSYQQLYPGIDAKFYGSAREMEYDFIVAPGADPRRIELRFEGADSVELKATGELIVRVGPRSLVWKVPVAYQEDGVARRAVACRYRIGRDTAQFELDEYDRSRPLTIDPVLTYSSFLGGSDFDAIEAIAVNSAGNIFVVGETASLNFPTVSGFKTNASGSNDVFVAKLTTNGAALVFSTYLGGSGDDFAHALDIDSSDNVFIAGMTDSPNFPLKNAFQNALSGALWPDGFFVKLTSAGNVLKYATYFGGPDYESANGIAVNANGTVFVVGETDSDANFPKRAPFQNNAGGFTDGFVAKFNPTLSGSSSLIWSSWIGGSDDDRATGVTADANGNAFVTGEVLALDYTFSDFPVKNAMQAAYGGGGSDAFVARVTLSGSVVFATYLGGEGDDTGYALAVDNNFIYLAGETSSPDFPAVNAAQPALAFTGYFALPDAFVTRFGTNGSNITYSTFLGGTFSERALGVAVDALGFIYLGGETSSTNFPVTVGAPQTQFGGIPLDAFAVKLNPNINGPGSLVFSTFLGGGGDDEAGDGHCVALNSAGDLFVAGLSGSTNFPTTTNAFDRTYHGGAGDAFIARLTIPPDLGIGVTLSTNPVLVGTRFSYVIKVANSGASNFTAVSLTNQLPSNASFVSVSTTRGSCTATGGIVTCNIGTLGVSSNVTITITARAEAAGAITNITRASGAEAETNTGNNVVLTPSIVRGIADLKVSCVVSPDPVLATSNLIYTLTVQNDGPWPATAVAVTNPLPPNLGFRFLHMSQGAFAYDGGTVALLIGTIQPESNATVTLTMRAGSFGPITNIFTASAFELDLSPINVSSNVTTVVPVADVSVVARVSAATVFVTSNVTFTTVISNAGPSAAASVTITNTLPQGIAWVSSSINQGACVFTNGLVICSISSLASNQTATLTVVGKATATGSMTNVATAKTSAVDFFAANDSAKSTVLALPLVDLNLVASISTNLAYTGNPIICTLRLTNRGPNVATSVRVTGAAPAGFYFLRANSDQGTWSLSGSQVQFAIDTLAKNESVTLAVTLVPLAVGARTSSFSASAAETDAIAADNTASTSFTVVAAPQLSILRGETNVILLWPTSAATFRLEQNLEGILSNWTLVTNPPAVTSNRNVLTNPVAGSNQFFRLRSP